MPLARRAPIAIVTGAARERGIGAAVCRILAQMEMNIFFTYWSAHDKSVYSFEQAGSQELLAAVQTMGVRCACAEVDLSQPEAAMQIMDAVESSLGTASVLVNNAAHDDTNAPFDQPRNGFESHPARLEHAYEPPHTAPHDPAQFTLRLEGDAGNGTFPYAYTLLADRR